VAQISLQIFTNKRIISVYTATAKNELYEEESFMNSILIIDDDKDLCELLSDYFAPEGFAVESVHNGLEGPERAISGNYSLVVLDVMLPGINGFEVLRRIRAVSQIPVLMLTARGEDVDRIVGLEIGADDYLPKPFNPRELVARIRAILRRAESQPAPQTQTLAQGDTWRLVVGDVELVPGTRTVRCVGQKVDLTSVEFAILETLLRQAGQVVSRDDLVKQALGRDFSVYDRSIDVHVSSLRKKLGSGIADAERIKTVRSIGYLYSADV
jgi:two-component system response regulator CpxR